MRQFTHALTAAALLVHAALGCCAHGVHDPTSASCGDAHAHAHDHDSDHCSHNVDVDHLQISLNDGTVCGEDSHHDGPHDCQHADCNWSAFEVRSAAEWLQLNLDAFLLASLSPPHESGGLAEAMVLIPPDGRPPNRSPVRAHLALCILLI